MKKTIKCFLGFRISKHKDGTLIGSLTKWSSACPSVKTVYRKLKKYLIFRSMLYTRFMKVRAFMHGFRCIFYEICRVIKTHAVGLSQINKWKTPKSSLCLVNRSINKTVKFRQMGIKLTIIAFKKSRHQRLITKNCLILKS